MLQQGTNQHITVLCCVSAAGATVPPLTIFSKGMPMYTDGPVNGTYASSDSGFVDTNIYFEWFTKNFLRFAPSERPLLLLQDGASAHMSLQLIEKAIEEDVILLCFPPKLTHILQPCDVGIYKTMKAELSKVMGSLRMIRSNLWINKAQFPPVFKQVAETTFTPSVICNAFRKCGIWPFDPSAISEELVNDPLTPRADVSTCEDHHAETNTTADSDNDNQTDQEDNQVFINMDIEAIEEQGVPEGAEVLHTGENQVCPPSDPERNIAKETTFVHG